MAGRDRAGARWNGFGEFSTRWISATDWGRRRKASMTRHRV